MKFKIQREALLKPLQQVIGVVERRQTLPVLANVLLQGSKTGLMLTATDLEVELSASVAVKVTDPSEVTIPARKFLDICRALPEQATIDIAVEEERAVVKSGKSRFTLSTLPAAEFPVIDEIKSSCNVSLPQKELKYVIEHTHFAMAQQDVRYYLNGLLLELRDAGIRGVATDGHRLAMCDSAAETPKGDNRQVIVPRKGIQELLRLLDDSDTTVQLQLGTNHIRVTLQDVRFTSKLVDGRFPDYQRVLPKGSDKEVQAPRELLRQALTRTSILSNEKYRGIRWMLEKNALRIQAHNPEQEEAEEELEVNYTGGALEIGFNVGYVLDAINALAGDKVVVHLSDSNSSCRICQPDSERCQYVVMPMRL